MKAIRFILIQIFIFGFGITCFSKTAYAVQSNDKTTLTFYYDNNEGRREGHNYSENNFGKWINNIKDIVKVVFDPSFSEYHDIYSTASWFYGCKLLKEIEGLNFLNTENVKDMSEMFAGCIALKELDLSHFVTSNVENMNSMFESCTFESIDLSSFDTRNVTNMSDMFFKCESLSLDLSNFDTRNVTDMSLMFCKCYKLKKINISTFNTEKVVTMDGMFKGCSSLEEIDVSSFDTENVKNMKGMFEGCYHLKQIDVANFDTRNVEDLSRMFVECKEIEELYLSKFNTEKVKDMSYMFSECYMLKTIYATDWPMTESHNMFKSCRKLVGGMGTCYDDHHIDAQYAHIDGGSDFPGYFTDKNATNVESTIKAEVINTYYNLNGNQSIHPHKGLNIVKKNNGWAHKVIIK